MPDISSHRTRLHDSIYAVFTKRATLDSNAARQLIGQLPPGSVTAVQRANAADKAQKVIDTTRKQHLEALSSQTLKTREDFATRHKDAALKSRNALDQSNLRQPQEVLKQFALKLRAAQNEAGPSFRLIVYSTAKDESELLTLLQRELGVDSTVSITNLGVQVAPLPLSTPGAVKAFALTFPMSEDKLGLERHNVIWALRRKGVFRSVRLASRYGFFYAATQPDHAARAEREIAWHLTQMRAREAQLPKPRRTGKQLGEGIIVAHLDTGWAPHNEYNLRQIDTKHSHNVLTGQTGESAAKHSNLLRDVHDFKFNITHGTATGCLILGGSLTTTRDGYASNTEQNLRFEVNNGRRIYGETQLTANNQVHLTGVAPKATVLPIKFISEQIGGDVSAEGVRGVGVLRFYDTELIEAIDYAIRKRAHVISLSIGGILGDDVRRKLDEAILKHNMIVVAAAGQTYVSNALSAISTILDFVGLGADDSVVEPAAFKNVIAVAGSTPSGRPWDESHRGPNVDITAPADAIWVAEFSKVNAKPNTNPKERAEVVECASGTSFATAIMAGVAALWVAHWGFDHLAQYYSGVPLAWVFRELLQRTANAQGGNWDKVRFGPGIVNVEAMLKAQLLPPSDIPEPPETVGNLMTAADSLVQGNSDAVEDLWGLAWDLILAGSDAAEGFAAGLTQLVQKTADEAVTMTRKTYEDLTAATEAASGDLRDELEKAVSRAKRDLEASVEASEKLIDETTEAGEELINQAEKAVKQVTDTVGEAAEHVWAWFFG